METLMNGRKLCIRMVLVLLVFLSMICCGLMDKAIATTQTTVLSMTEPTITVVELTEENIVEATTEVVEDNSLESTSESVEEPIEKLKSVEDLSPSQREKLNMLNHMTLMTTQINKYRRDRVFLKSAEDFFINDIHPYVDVPTQAHIMSMMDTIHKYQMTNVKWDRLEYIYEQEQAQALRKAIPNPIGLLSAVKSGSMLKTVVSGLYMTVDSLANYESAISDAEQSYLKSGWELKDTEAVELHNSTKDSLSYIFDMARKNGFTGDSAKYILRAENIERFIDYVEKPDSQRTQRLYWFKNHQDTYEAFGPYWLELAKDYYNTQRYEECLWAIAKYEDITSRLTLKDRDYAKILPMAIMSAKETMSDEEYCVTAERYCDAILTNIKDDDWNLRYYVAQTYLDISSITGDKTWLDKAYEAVKNNVVNLVDEQRNLNATYQQEFEKQKYEQGATKRQRKETDQYNNLVKKQRKVALPPVSEALYLNCDLLFALAKECEISESEKTEVNNILHENETPIFLITVLDDRFWFGPHDTEKDETTIKATFEGDTLIVPAAYVSDRSVISVSVESSDETITIDDWTVTKVERHKSKDVADFSAFFESKSAKDYKFKVDDKVTVRIIPVVESKDNIIELQFNAVNSKKMLVIKDISFERIEK